MENTHPHLYKAADSLPLSVRADLARELISANDLYRISNSLEYAQAERDEALAESAKLTSSVLSQTPNDTSALNLAARIEMDKNKLREANELLSKALKLDSKNLNTNINLGYLKLAQKEPENAESIFKQALKIDETSHRAFSGIARAKLSKKDFVGAFQHYRKLIELGLDNDQSRTFFLESAEKLTVDFYQENIEEIVLSAFRWENQDLEKLASVSASLLVHKYDLTNENAAINMEEILADELFLQACRYTLMPSMPVEELIVAVRQSILQEISITQNLRDNVLPAVIAIGQYAAKTDYSLMLSHEEELETVRLTHEIQARINTTWQCEDLAGALLVLSMYEALYTTPFSFKLLGTDLEDWPLGMQDLMQNALYDLSEEHQYQYQLYGNTVQSLLNNEVRRSADRWEHLPKYHRKSLYHALCAELEPAVIPKRFQHKNLNILLLGCGSGKRALLLANSFSNVNIIAVDDDVTNVAYTKMKIDKHKSDNIQVVHSSYDTALFHDQNFDIVEFGDILNHSEFPEKIIEAWLELLAYDGIARLSLDTIQASEQVQVIHQLVKARKLSATTENIRHLRHAISQENGTGLWHSLLTDPRFYSGSGCKQLFFKQFNQGFDLQGVNKLLQSTNLDFIGFADLDKVLKEKLNPLSPYNLIAWHVMDQDSCLFSDAYQLYVTRSSGS